MRRGPDAPFGTKVEIKNMNSFSAIQKACEYEIKRQIKAYETGEPIVQETRLWDEGKQLTKSMRSKEGASDYRYFPDPDLGPIEVSADQRESWRAELPELPAASGIATPMTLVCPSTTRGCSPMSGRWPTTSRPL